MNDKKIDIKRTGEKDTNPDQLVSYLSKVYGVNSVHYSQASKPNTGTLFLTTNESYDIQEVYNRIFDSGYIIPPDFQSKPVEKTIPQKISSSLENLLVKVKHARDDILREIRDKKDIEDLLEKNQKKGDRE